MIFNTKLAVAATMAMSSLVAVAQPIHIHNVHKREAEAEAQEIVTVYVTAGVADVAAAVASSTSVAVAVATSTAASVASAVSSSSAGSSDASGSSSASGSASASGSSTASSSSSAASASSSSSSSFTGGSKGVVYSPYKVGGCKTAAEVKSDIAALSSYSVIRIYGVDCDQVTNVLAALADGQKVFLGIYDVTAIEAGLSTINDAVSSYGWDVVYTISIGNELVNSGAATVAQISAYIATAKAALTTYGYTGPIVSVDTFIAVINNPGLCALSDYIAVNTHPFFDGGVAAKDSGKWVVEQIQRVWSACDAAGYQKTVFVTESGWPSQGDNNNLAVPGVQNQLDSVNSIKTAAGDSCILFTAYNDLWKAPGSYNAEQYWGIYGTSSS